jgi:hypothetical protein
VQVSFVIRDAAGYLVANPKSSAILLHPGEEYIFSTTWIADEPSYYRFTAYSLYGVLTPTIQESFSRTLRLKATY